MRKFLLFFCFVTCTETKLLAQFGEKSVNYGLKVGATNSKITGLETTILSEPYFLNYTMNARSTYGATAGFFVNYREEEDRAWGLESQLMYAQQGSDIFFNNVEKDFHYKMWFKYQYINILGQFKLYPFCLLDAARNNPLTAFHGFYAGVGPQLGLAIAPDNITYTSGGTGKLDAFGSDLQQQQQIRNVLKGKTNLGLSIGVGNEFARSGFAIDLRYFLGLTDVVETQSNAYNFIENKNINRAFQLTVAWDFSMFND